MASIGFHRQSTANGGYVMTAGTQHESMGLSVAETAQTLGLSETSVRQALRAGVIPAVRIGRRLVIPRSGLERTLSSRCAPTNEDKDILLPRHSRANG